FQQAIQLDPGYAPAYAGLSDFYALSDALPPAEALPKAREYAQQALRLDPDLPASHVSLAYVYFYGDWNWPAADQEFKRAIALAALIHGRLGQMEQAGKLVHEMRIASQKSFVAPFFFATAFVGMSKEKEAMEALEEGYKAHDGYMVGLNSTPWFGPLRFDPR